MPDRSIEARLRELHAPRVEPPTPSPEAEAEALARWAGRYEHGRTPTSGSGSSFGVLGLLAAHRLAVAIGALIMMVVGACVLPTSYDIPLGLSLEIRAPAGEEIPVRDIAQYVRERADASEVDVMMREFSRDGGAPQAELSIRLWDQSLALGELEPELRERFPALADADIVETALEGEVSTIWARRLAHHAFRMSLREADVEQARRHLLLELQAKGFDEHEVVVKVRDHDDGHREVEVQIEHRQLGEGEPVPSEDEPAFQWVMDPSAHGPVDLRAPPHEPIQIHVKAGDGEPE